MHIPITYNNNNNDNIVPGPLCEGSLETNENKHANCRFGRFVHIHTFERTRSSEHILKYTTITIVYLLYTFS